MTTDDRRTAVDPAGATSVPPPAAQSPAAGPAGDPPHPGMRVDVLREAVELDQHTAKALRLWLIGNDLHATPFQWPVMIDFHRRRLWATDPQGNEFTVPLIRTPMAPLWRSLADHGALWCARTDHATLDDPRCPHRVDVAGEHTQYVDTQRLEDRHPRMVPTGPITSYPNVAQRPDHIAQDAADAPLELAITQALERAAPGCEHTDPAGPIYDPTRACAQCGAAAVLELFRTADAIEAFRARHTPPTAGYWEAGRGHRFPGHPGGFRPV